MHVVERGDHEGDGICRNKVSDSSSTVERLPPPLVVLIAQLQVGGNHRHLSRDHACENSGKEDKSKKVVEVSLPHGRHGEVKHDENVAEDQETAAQGEDNAGDLLARHLPRDLVGADRVGADRLLGGNVAAKQAQRDGHQPPQAQDHEVGLQGDGPNSASLVQHDVQDGEHEHGDAREVERSTHRCSRPPSVALGNHAIDVHCAVSGHAGQQDVHANARAEQSPTRGGRKESQRRKEDGHQRAQQDLDACADLHAEMHGRGGRAEHVAHDQLPAKLLLKLRFCVAHNLLVLHEVTPDRAQQDDHHHARQHECHDQGVDDGEPVDLKVVGQEAVARVLLHALLKGDVRGRPLYGVSELHRHGGLRAVELVLGDVHHLGRVGGHVDLDDTVLVEVDLEVHVREEEVAQLRGGRTDDLLHLADEAPDGQVVVKHLEVVIIPHGLPEGS
mmetsp:Transcript_46827/g.117222  ORF Transcript_46827/g.117222 Transcript_46827/m.117222 type:complete len:445 (+) Transcript_46827:262-1596(+)